MTFYPLVERDREGKKQLAGLKGRTKNGKNPEGLRFRESIIRFGHFKPGTGLNPGCFQGDKSLV